MTPTTMTPMERAQALRRALQDSFRIDLYSIVAERDFERLLAEAIAAAEQDAYHRGRELGRSGNGAAGREPQARSAR
ncbi:MAG TPA: hypothetical protein VD995_03385 [Azospirillum sp.]|nr:hypothetical protein [Azospirillum sp.]